MEEERLKKEEADKKNSKDTNNDLDKQDYTFDINGDIIFVKKNNKFISEY